jgi:hypothetical protein
LRLALGRSSHWNTPLLALLRQPHGVEGVLRVEEGSNPNGVREWLRDLYEM